MHRCQWLDSDQDGDHHRVLLCLLHQETADYISQIIFDLFQIDRMHVGSLTFHCLLGKSCYTYTVKKQDLLSILITFTVGFFVGGYLYVSNVAGLVARVSTPEAADVSTLVIVADAYGGCRSACPSFQVTADGSYRYMYVPAARAEKIIRQGTLPRAVREQIAAAMTPQALAKQSQPIEPAYCASYTDGIDIVYEIELAGRRYTLDSCGTAVEADSALWQALGGIWTYFERGGK